MIRSQIRYIYSKIKINLESQNFSIIPTIEKSLKSGNREYCRTISASNPRGLLIVKKMHGKEFKVSKTYIKYCFDESHLKIPSGNHDIVNGGFREARL